MKNDEESNIKSTGHVPSLDTECINKALERANMDRNFISFAVDQLSSFDFPAYKARLIQFLKDKSADKDVICLFESLNADRPYKDVYQIQKALEQENPDAKEENQITDQTRKNLKVSAVKSSYGRKDYPDVPAIAPKDYACMLCGKSFQTRDDLIHHQEFEFK